MNNCSPTFLKGGRKQVLQEIGQSRLKEALKRMLLIRNFEARAEAAYQQGKIGGFFHSYIGQEAIQTASIEAMGVKNWWITSYRCHALALLLGATPSEIMAELYGRSTGNAKGRGGSMHLYTERLLGGFGIVGGQVPIATGAAFTIKYTNNKDEVAICYLGDGAVAQGAFHESLNLASLWNLPCIYVIENNKWGMGTAVTRALTNRLIAEERAPGYNIKGYTFDGMDFIDCYAGFKHVYQSVLEDSKPVLVEVIAERFKGHSISDPGLYRTKEQLKSSMTRDPILLFQKELIENHVIDEAEIKQMDKECRERVIEAMKHADESPWPDPGTLGEDVFAPEPEGIFE
ncbi:MAG: pyruvate dehydrogenase (acetyl-transferring) E1 component subunit alpha [Parachlamydiaceae bacterium]